MQAARLLMLRFGAVGAVGKVPGRYDLFPGTLVRTGAREAQVRGVKDGVIGAGDG